MELKIPFFKKKEAEKSASELNAEIDAEIEKLTHKKHKKISPLMDLIDDPVDKRMVKNHLADVVWNKKGGFAQVKPMDHGGHAIERETMEVAQHNYQKTEFIEPIRRFKWLIKYPDIDLEGIYNWFVPFITETWGFNDTEKVIDTLGASVASSNFGNIQSRLSAQQGQASQYLKGVSEMIKGLFQIVREIRVLDERLQYYYDSDGDEKGNKENTLSSEIVLKGLWVDQVEGGAKNPGSVYGLSQSIGFTILPDLFFRAQISDVKKIDSEVDKLKFNEKVKEVLKRKLRQYYEWKKRTKHELLVRRNYEIKYLRQHYQVIKLYMSWVKPYLKNIRLLQLKDKNMDNPHLMHSFETQIIEIETLFKRTDFGHHFPVMSLHIAFRGMPEPKTYPNDYQHKGMIYKGLIVFTLRGYVWDKDMVKHYVKYRTDDDLDLMSEIDKSVAESMEALGDELHNYLEEAEGKKDAHDDHGHGDGKDDKPSMIKEMFEPFTAIGEGIKDIFDFGKSKKPQKEGGEPIYEKPKPGKKKAPKRSEQVIHNRAHHFVHEAVWETYYRFKMGPGSNLYWVE